MVLALVCGAGDTWWVQGKGDPNVELLDAAALCGHLVPAGSVPAFLAEHRRALFPDEMFEDLFPSGRGRPSVPADVIATVMVLQALEGLSDRDAVQAIRRDIAWKVAAGLSLVERNQQWLATRLAALNLRRLVNLGLTRDELGWAIG